MINLLKIDHKIVILLTLLLMSCSTSKIDPNTEKIAVLGKDYTIEKYKMKKREIGGACHVLKLVYSYFVSLSDIHLFKKLSL